MEMQIATALTSPSAWAELFFIKCKQHAIHDPKGSEKYNYTLV